MKTQSPDMRALLASIVELIISLNFFGGCRQRRKGVFGPEPDQSGRLRDVTNDRSGNLSGWPE